MRETAAGPKILDDLFAVIESRKGADPETSYTARLFDEGTNRIAQKVGEEALECVIAATAGSRTDLTAESADLLYHLLVLWADQKLPPDAVWQALGERRQPAKRTAPAGDDSGG